VDWEPCSYTGYLSGSLKAGNVSGSHKAGNVSGSGLETRQAQVKTVKEMWYHHGSKPGSHLGLREVMLWPGSLAAAQDTCQAHLRLETCQAHIRLETRQAQLETRQAQGKMVKEKWYHHGSKSGSLLRLREVILWPGNVAAIQGALQADIMLETRQAQGCKHVRLRAGNSSGSSQNC
jgi:hypothetical protein